MTSDLVRNSVSFLSLYFYFVEFFLTHRPKNGSHGEIEKVIEHFTK